MRRFRRNADKSSSPLAFSVLDYALITLTMDDGMATETKVLTAMFRSNSRTKSKRWPRVSSAPAAGDEAGARSMGRSGGRAPPDHARSPGRCRCRPGDRPPGDPGMGRQHRDGQAVALPRQVNIRWTDKASSDLVRLHANLSPVSPEIATPVATMTRRANHLRFCGIASSPDAKNIPLFRIGKSGL